eukprot:SAG31_NODE_371_length_16628_cov_3.741943_3_plen_173_part_00
MIIYSTSRGTGRSDYVVTIKTKRPKTNQTVRARARIGCRPDPAGRPDTKLGNLRTSGAAGTGRYRRWKAIRAPSRSERVKNDKKRSSTVSGYSCKKLTGIMRTQLVRTSSTRTKFSSRYKFRLISTVSSRAHTAVTIPRTIIDMYSCTATHVLNLVRPCHANGRCPVYPGTY